MYCKIWGFPKILGPFLRVPRIKAIVFGIYIGVPFFLGTYDFDPNSAT